MLLNPTHWTFTVTEQRTGDISHSAEQKVTLVTSDLFSSFAVDKLLKVSVKEKKYNYNLNGNKVHNTLTARWMETDTLNH